jgi:hypothetical protein
LKLGSVLGGGGFGQKAFYFRSVQIWFDFVDGVKLLRCEAVVLL